MPTRLSRYAEGVMEAAWLAAIIVVPVFFNVYSSRIFEPDKITLLRSLALLILAAWTVKLVEEGRPRWENLPREGSWLRSVLRIPLIAPVAALVAAYLLATLFSVTPYTSFWGSYQRLQGTYTTLAYVVVFAALVAHLRRRVQVERLIGVAIYSSLPVSLYGILQRYHADPIPWGGDVSARIAANMGNSIFVAAFLIMVFPLTAMRIVEAFEALLRERGHSGANFARATIYIFIFSLQAVALYFSGSRGPWLGWAASLVLMWLGLSLVWRKRWMVVSGVVVALLAGTFLVLLNIPDGPLESLRSRPEFGRLGQLLDSESRTGRVRTLIWQGAVELVQPHAPLEYPDGRTDVFNFLRPLIGYGPESMYVAYNRFYQPELTLVERRNASPDRSHNETWDSLVITGLLGLLVYLTLFGAVIYYGLKWLGLVPGKRQRNLFLGLYIAGGLIVAGVFWAWRGPAYLGVALPFGMIFGVMVYLIIASLTARIGSEATPEERLQAYVLLGLVGGVVAHFVEINFGIAIAATRTYFWAYAALVLLVGYVLPRRGEYWQGEAAPAETENGVGETGAPLPVDERIRAARTPGRKKRTPARQGAYIPERHLPAWFAPAATAGILVALLLGTLGYEYISNASRGTGALALIGASLTSLDSAGGGSSYGLAALLLTTWLAGCILLVSEELPAVSKPESATRTWATMLGAALGISALLAAVFWVFHAGGLASLNRVQATDISMVIAQVARSEGLLSRYYVYLFMVLFGAGLFLPGTWPAAFQRSAAGAAVGAVALAAAFLLIATTNLRIIQADIAFKTAEVFARPGSWPVAIEVYDRARDLAPNEDYYYLFLGRAYLEHAKTLENPVERDSLIASAADDLEEAQRINPLNTDHTANLARLYSLWSSYTEDPIQKAERAQKADDYFSRALVLSPMNARLWDEWAVHVMNNLDEPETGYEYLQRAVEIDPYYDWTYALLGDYFGRFAGGAADISPDEKADALIQASEYYTTAVFRADPANVSQLYGYLISYGGMQAQLGDLPKAIQAYQRALQVWPDNPERWRVEAAIAQLYAQSGDLATALQYAQQALTTVPEEQRSSVEDLIRQFGQ